MKNILFVFAVLLSTATMQAGRNASSYDEMPTDFVETNKDSVEEKEYDDPVETQPGFPGGFGALMKYLSTNIKYPEEAERLHIQGRVVCTFVVRKNGAVSDVKVKQSVDPQLDGEAVRVIRRMPKWIPGKRNGEDEDVGYTLPITFKLR
jgi:protein TonB